MIHLLLPMVLAASATKLTPAQICALSLSGDERLARLDDHPFRAPAVLVARSKLMNEAWWPAMRLFRDLVVDLGAEEISRRRREWEPELDLEPRHYDKSEVWRIEFARSDGYHYDGGYEQYFRLNARRLGIDPLHPAHIVLFPFRAGTRDFMKKVYLTSVILLLTIGENAEALGAAFPRDGLEILKEHSFTRDAADQTLFIAVKTIVQSLALVTASPIENVDAADLARRCSVPRRGTSSIERVALRSPPEVFASHGDDLFVDAPVSLDAQGRTHLTRRLTDFMESAHDVWFAKKTKEVYEFGFGCPLAYPAPRAGERTGVGLALEAFWHVYDRI